MNRKSKISKNVILNRNREQLYSVFIFHNKRAKNVFSSELTQLSQRRVSAQDQLPLPTLCSLRFRKANECDGPMNIMALCCPATLNTVVASMLRHVPSEGSE